MYICIATYTYAQISFALVVNGVPWEEYRDIVTDEFAAAKKSHQMILDLPIGTHSTYIHDAMDYWNLVHAFIYIYIYIYMHKYSCSDAYECTHFSRHA